MPLSKELTIDLSISIKIDSDQLNMYHPETGKTKKYNRIPENEIGHWIIADYAQVLKKCNDYTTEECRITDI